MRTRSFWAWGYEDKLPDEETRRGLVGFVEALLGFSGLAPAPLPSLEAIELAAPRAALADLPFCSTDRLARIHHTHGRSFRDVARGFAGDFRAAPDVVAVPRDEVDLAQLFERCAKDDLVLVPYGGGTSVVSGIEVDEEHRRGGVVTVDLSALDRVLEVDEVSRAARIQAGARGPVLEAQLAPYGLSLRFFPQSFELSTLGGWLATRAGGHFATVYTHIDDLTESIRMLTPVGVWASRRLPASGAGPSPDRLALGSEGTLGVITEAWMKLHPRPRHRTRATVLFPDFERAVAAVRRIAQAALHPTNCRLLDAHEAGLHRVTQGEDVGKSVLVLAYESADRVIDEPMARAVAICAEEGGVAPRGISKKTDDGGADDAGAAWKQAFVEAPYLQGVLLSLGVIADTFETACTWDAFPRLHAGVTEAVHEAMRRVGGGGKLTCRFTHVYPDGPAPYYTFLVPARGDVLAAWHEIKQAACEALLAHGGTITHHHAVGRMHRPFYDRQRPAPFAAALRAAQRAVDPHGILNPGVLLPVEP